MAAVPHEGDPLNGAVRAPGPGRVVCRRVDWGSTPISRTDQKKSRRCMIVVDGFYMWKKVGRNTQRNPSNALLGNKE